MGESIHIFVGSNESPEVFAQEIEKIVGIELRRDVSKVGLNPDVYLYDFADLNNNWWFGIVRHVFVNTEQLNFEDYQYDIEVVAFENRRISLQRSLDYARRIFDQLRASRKYRLMMTENLYPKLLQYDRAEDV